MEEARYFEAYIIFKEKNFNIIVEAKNGFHERNIVQSLV